LIVRPYEVGGVVIVIVAPGGNWKSEAGGDAE
jgi:hypothetical protein